MGELLQAIILVVEDHEDTRDLWVAVLESEGFRAVAVADAPAALRQTRLVRFDAVILDLGLRGEMDGYELARRLRASGQRGIIAASGHTLNPGTEDTLFDVYLLKPVLPEVIVRAVRDSLARPQDP